ncbi:helix-turn-helix domain-containing protein [Iamia sp. SCSIO 61187]|nr:helix-turn-helix domain-containing protein [Iamia sp. SCSIO 61187]
MPHEVYSAILRTLHREGPMTAGRLASLLPAQDRTHTYAVLRRLEQAGLVRRAGNKYATVRPAKVRKTARR